MPGSPGASGSGQVLGNPSIAGPLSAQRRPSKGYSPTGIIRLQVTAVGTRGSGRDPRPLVSFSHAVMFGHHLSLPHTSGFVRRCWFDLFNFSVSKANTLPRRRWVCPPALHLEVTGEGEYSCKLSWGSLSYLPSNKPALIGQGFVSISLGNLLKGLRGNHMKNNCCAQQRIAWIRSLFPLYFSSAHLISLVNWTCNTLHYHAPAKEVLWLKQIWPLLAASDITNSTINFGEAVFYGWLFGKLAA